MRRIIGTTLVSALLLTQALPAAAEIAAYRFTDLDLRDPHFFVSIIGCRDITDVAVSGYSVNGSIQADIQADDPADGDSLLDLSYLLLFDPVDPSVPGGTLGFRTGACTAPMAGTVCEPDGSPALLLTFTNDPSNPCLTFLPGTVRPYSPAVTSASAPCLVTDESEITLSLAGIPITLRDARIAATYSGNPPGHLVNGLLRGFLRESDAAATILPPSLPLIGGMPLAAVLADGSNNCASHSDEDPGPDGENGWWFYFNFSAAAVDYLDGTAGIPAPAPPEGIRVWPNPFTPSIRIEFTTARERRANVAVMDPQGRQVAKLLDGAVTAGSHLLEWKGRDAAGTRVRPGVYFIRFETETGTAIRRIALLR